jgi:hypothetical protein
MKNSIYHTLSRFVASSVTGLTLLLVPGTGNAIPLSIDGGWHTFDFGAVGTSWSPTNYTFSLSGPAVLIAVDAYLAGDRFEIFDNGLSLGSTSLPAGGGGNIGNNFDLALTNPNFSSGQFLLAAGNHDISGTVLVSTGDQGTGALRVDTVPEPSSLLLMALGLVGAGFATRRRLFC